MYCPFCRAQDSKVVDSRLSGEGEAVRRRRQCIHCGGRFTTYETIEMSLPRIVKRDGSRCAFDENKLRRSMQLALEKRPVTQEQLDQAILDIRRRLQNGEREVSSQTLGAWVTESLQQLDAVAYLRFASVYFDFKDIDAFVCEARKMTHAKRSRVTAPISEPDEGTIKASKRGAVTESVDASVGKSDRTLTLPARDKVQGE